MKTFIAYYRVSTKTQSLSIGAQKTIVQNYLTTVNSNNLSGVSNPPLEEYIEVESGKKTTRPELKKAIERCKVTGATLLVAKLDRLARNVYFVSTLMNAGIEFIAADMPSANNLTIHILAAVAEEEARLISERTKSALAEAKRRGTKLGRPNGLPVRTWKDSAPDQRRNARKDRAEDTYRDVLPLVRELRSRGDSLSSIASTLNSYGYRTPRGCQFRTGTISQLLERVV